MFASWIIVRVLALLELQDGMITFDAQSFLIECPCCLFCGSFPLRTLRPSGTCGSRTGDVVREDWRSPTFALAAKRRKHPLHDPMSSRTDSDVGP